MACRLSGSCRYMRYIFIYIYTYIYIYMYIYIYISLSLFINTGIKGNVGYVRAYIGQRRGRRDVKVWGLGVCGLGLRVGGLGFRGCGLQGSCRV